MKKLILFSILYISISCSTLCEEVGEIVPKEPEDCHKLTSADGPYCCYYEGKNLDTNQEEKYCWGYYRERIDNDKVKEVIDAIEKGTDSHVTKKHSDVKLDCFSFYEKLNYFLFALAWLLF